MDIVRFINLEEDDKDLILSFALDEGDGSIRSLIVHRALLLESLLPDEERGTKVTLEGEELEGEKEHLNTLQKFDFADTTLRIKSRFSRYELDAGNLGPEEFKVIKQALERQNYDGRFQIKFT